jgi:hypothetical protein
LIYPDFGKNIVLPRTAAKDGAGNLFDSEVRVEPCKSLYYAADLYRCTEN